MNFLESVMLETIRRFEMDKSFMREFYRIFYADSFPNTVKELEA